MTVPTPASPVVLHDQGPNGASFRTPTGLLRLQVHDPRTIRVTACPGPAFREAQSLMVVAGPTEASRALTEHRIGWELATDHLRVRLDRASGRLTWFDAEGHQLLAEPVKSGRQFDPTPVYRGVVEQCETVQSVDGQRGRASSVRYVLDRQAWHAKLSFVFQPGEALYGLGQHDQGYLNLRGTSQLLFQQNMKVAMPVLLSTRGWGLLLDTASLVSFHDDGHGSYLWADVVDELDYYVIAGRSFDRIVAGLRRLTGRATMLPRWAWGYAQSKERYKTQQELIDVVAEYRRRRLPLDVIIQDWCTWPDGMWGEKQFDPTRYPDPRALTDELHRQHAHLLVSIWPNMRGGPDTQAMRQHGFLLGNDSTYNAFDPAARKLYWEQAENGYWRYGIDGWWCDCTEPFEADWKGSVKPEPWDQLRIDVEEFKKYLDPQTINAYSLVHSQGLYEHQRVASPDRRMVNLTRSGFPGQQRYGTITWSGDVDATWDTLRKQIPAGLNFCAAGTPYWTHDIGAFFVHSREQWFWRGDYEDGVADLGYRELYVRWFQFGALTPMFRSHGTDTPREVWRFGEPGTPHYDALVSMLHLRYRLLPYLYSLAGWVHHRDYTPMRLLAFDFPDDPMVHDLRDQYMFGPALLVCPVTHPMFHGPGSKPLDGVAQTRRTYLPLGAEWYDFWTGRRHPGGTWIDAAAPLDRIPLFIRGGSLLPLGPVVQHTQEQPQAELEVRIYPGSDGSFDIYDDSGDGYDYERGAYAWLALRWSDGQGRLMVGPRTGEYAGMPMVRSLRALKVDEDAGMGLAEWPGLTQFDVGSETLTLSLG